MWLAVVYDETDSLVMICGPFKTETEAFNWASDEFSVKHKIYVKPLVTPYPPRRRR